MLTFEQKSNWIINNQARIAKVEKAVIALEEAINKAEAHKSCVDYNFHKELGLFSGTTAEYNQLFAKHENDITKCCDIIGDAITKRGRLNSLKTKLVRHEKVIFALPHTW